MGQPRSSSNLAGSRPQRSASGPGRTVVMGGRCPGIARQGEQENCPHQNSRPRSDLWGWRVRLNRSASRSRRQGGTRRRHSTVGCWWWSRETEPAPNRRPPRSRLARSRKTGGRRRRDCPNLRPKRVKLILSKEIERCTAADEIVLLSSDGVVLLSGDGVVLFPASDLVPPPWR